MSFPCRLLHLDRDRGEGERVREALEGGHWTGVIQTEVDAVGFGRAVQSGAWDVVLVGEGIQDMSLDEVLQVLGKRLAGVPLVYCADGDGEGERRVRGLGGRGFSGVVWKDRLGGLSLVLEGLASSFGVALHRMREAQAVRRSQESLRALFDAVPESLFLMELNGTILEANLGFATRFGKRVEEVVGRSLFDLVPPPLVEMRREWIRQVERTLQPVIHEEPWGERWLRHHYCPVFGLDRKLERIVVLGLNITEQRKAEEAMRRSQQLAEGVFDSVAGQIAVVDGTGRILHVNAAWRLYAEKEVTRDLPLTEECGVGGNYLRAWENGGGDDSSDGRMAMEGIRSVIEGRRDFFSMDYACHTAKERRWYQLSVTPLGHEGGGAVIAHTNITGRKLAEEEVQRRLKLQDQLSMVAASVPGLIFSFRLGTDGVMSMPFANEALFNLFEVEPEKVRDDFSLGFEFVHPDDKENLLRSIENSARNLTPWHEMLRVVLPGRGERWLEGHSVPRREADGSVVWHGFLQDITERKRGEQVLAAEVTRRRMLIEGSRDGIVVLNASGGVVEASHRFADMLGYSLEEVKALRVWEWDRNWTEEMVVQDIQTMGPEGHFFETRHWRKDGSSFAVEISNSLAVVDGQRLVFCVCRDVSDRKQTEEREARNRLMTEFLLELHQRAPQMNDRELYDHVLERAVALTQSEIGFFHQVSEDQDTIILTAWNHRALEQCSAPFESHYPLRQAGSWVDCVRKKKPVVCNDYERSLERRGLPEGHAKLHRFMSIPVIHDGKARIIFGVGNKEVDYQEEDVAQLQVVANELHKLMIQRGIQNQLRQLSKAVEQSPVGILIARTGGGVEYVNPKYAEDSGMERGFIMGGSLGSFLVGHWGLSVARAEELMRSLKEGGSWAGEVRRPGLGEESRWESVALSPITNESGEVTHILGIREDVTESRRAMEALQVSEERYRSLVEASSDWVWEVDHEGRFTYCSPRIETILGFTPAEVIGRHPFEFMVLEESEKAQAALADIAAVRKPFSSVEVVGRHRSGGKVLLETTGVPVKGREGQVLGYLGMARDVTARRHLEEQFRQAQKLEAVGHLAGGVAHDFNNILAAIMMNFELLREDASLGPEARENLLELETEARRAAGVTRQLLMFSRRSVLDVRVLNMNEVVEGVLKMLRRLLGEHVELEFHPDSNLPAVEADPGMLEQVVLNLAVNARDAMPRGGKITIGTYRETVDAQRAAQHSDSRPGCFACLSIADTGCGMDAETMGKIFEPFFTTKDAYRGTGLGLATVHGIVGQHKGWIEVKSAPGRGSEFRLYFPVVERPTPVVRAEPSPDVAAFRGKETLLVVEDEPSVRRSLGQILGILGYTVLEAADSRQALELWKSKGDSVSLIITDMVMPGSMNGLELAEHLLGERPDLKVIISSGYSDAITREGKPDNPRIVFLSKPYDLQALGSCLRRCLG